MATGGRAPLPFVCSFRGARDPPPSRPPSLLAAPCPSSRSPQPPCSAPRASSGLAGSLPAAPGGGARAGSPLPRARRRSLAEPGGPAAAGHVGRIAPPGRLRRAPAAGDPGPWLHREEDARALRGREVSAPRPSPAPPRERYRRGAGRRGGASRSCGSGRPPGPLSARGRSPGGPDKGTAACALGGCPFCAPGRGCPDWDLAGGTEIQALGEPH